MQLQTLKKNLTKDIEEDETILSNTYDPVEGSPRYTKNKRRENEVFKKANISYEGDAISTAVSGSKKSKRALPPPPVQNEYESDKNALRSEIKLHPEDNLGQKKKGKKGTSRRGDGGGGVAETESDREDDFLQEYQQQITQEEQKVRKKTQQKKQNETLQEITVLNNEFEKKKKKKIPKESKGNER